MPGNWANWSIRFSSGSTLLLNIGSLLAQTGDVQTAGHLGHLLLGVLVNGSGGAVDGGGNQILKHFNIIGVDGLGLDLDGGDLMLAVHRDSDHLTAGGMFAESGGHFCDPLFAFLMTYNAVKGNYTKDEGSFGYEIEFPYLYVSSPDDYENYQKYFVDDDPYTDEEIVEMAGYSFDDLNKAATSLSIDDVISRHSN